MIVYLSGLICSFFIFYFTDWTETISNRRDEQFKLLFCFLSAVLWPLFVVTLVLDAIIIMYKKFK